MKAKQKSSFTFAKELSKYVEDSKTFYCMPGHKQGKGAPDFLKKIWGKEIFKYDLTEVRGSDVLSYPKRGLISAQKQASEIMGAQKSWFLVNGSSVGVYATLIALVKPGEKVLIHRACHKSVVTGLVLSGAHPIYIDSISHLPEYTYGSVNLNELEELLKNHNIKLCLLTSPNYYGATLDIDSISKLCHKHNTILFVDEAHGAHFCLNKNLPPSALHSGADYVVHSMHKTLGGLYQCAILHSRAFSSCLDEQVELILSMLQTTSPSNLFLISIDMALSYAKTSGNHLYEVLINFLRDIAPKLNNTFFEAVEPHDKQMIAGGFIGFDLSKIIFRVKNDYDINLIEIKQKLSLIYDIEIELASKKHLLLTLTMADALDLGKTKSNLLRFSNLIFQLAKNQDSNLSIRHTAKSKNIKPSVMPKISPRDAFYEHKKSISLSMADGKISAGLLCIYPPGSPIVIPGEKFNADTIEKIYRSYKAGFNIIGLRDTNEDLLVNVVEEEDTRMISVIENFESNVRRYCRDFPVLFVKAKGAFVWDKDGNKFTDLFTAAGSLNYGHNHPLLIDVAREVINQDFIIQTLDFYTPYKANFIKAFKEKILQPRSLEYKFEFVGPTGASTIEAAILLARKATGKKRIVSFKNSFHGMSTGARSISNALERGAKNVSTLPYFSTSHDAIQAIELTKKLLSNIKEETAAIFIEIIQGEGGINVANKEWLKFLSSYSKEHGILFIVDDIQAGCGRAGTFFSFESAGIKPDVICLSKSLSGLGLPMSMLLIAPKYDVWEPGEHSGTFRGNSIVFCTSARMLDFWSDKAFLSNLDINITYMREWAIQIKKRAKELGILEVRGVGMMYGLEFENTLIAKDVKRELFENKIIAEFVRNNRILKLLPPLNIEKEALLKSLEIITSCCIKSSSKYCSKTLTV